MLNSTWLGVLAFTAMTVVGAATTEAQDIVLYSSDVSNVQGNWYAAASSTGAGGQRMTSNDYGWSATDAPLANPGDYFEANFTAPSYTTYRVWVRVRATNDSKWNDSLWVQFSDAINTSGSAAYRIGTSDALLVNLEQCNGCGAYGWGWVDTSYWTGQSPYVMFGARGTHTIRVQTREDGVQVDQIVLSPSTYLNAAPGSTYNDSTILPHSTDGRSGAVASGGGSGSGAAGPHFPWAASIPGTINAQDYDDGGEGVSYHDTTSGNSGGAYRSDNVDLEASADGNNDVGWIAAGEWLNYTVNVASSGSYIVHLRVASPGGGSMKVGFNKTPGWNNVSVPSTGDWQAWTTVDVPVTLNAGTQLMTLYFNTSGFNLNQVKVDTTPSPSGSGGGSGGSGSGGGGGGTTYTSSGSFRMMTWNIQHGTTAYGAYDLSSQAQFIASQRPDVVALQEVETWDENQPQRYKQLLEQYTGNSWTVVWAPVINSSGTEGNVILTRLPVSSQNAYQMHANGDYSALYSNRSVAQATVNVGGVDVNVFSTHLDYYNTGDRTTQEQQLMSWALNFGGPRLVSGDFNSWWGEYWITNMQTQYTDTWQDVTGSNQNGYTVNNAVRFDYIFRSMDGGWRATPTNVYVPVTSLSDHNPVVADYRVQ
jgi:endonuclease/exonuclease/phosphatase family metal-dependent hydrolase